MDDREFLFSCGGFGIRPAYCLFCKLKVLQEITSKTALFLIPAGSSKIINSALPKQPVKTQVWMHHRFRIISNVYFYIYKMNNHDFLLIAK